MASDFTSLCPLCGADLIAYDASENDAPCEHLVIDVDVFFRPAPETGEPLIIWLGSRLDRELLVGLHGAVAAYTRSSSASTNGLPTPLRSLVATIQEDQAAESEEADDRKADTDVESLEAWRDYLLNVIPPCPGFHSVTEYEDNIPMQTALHHAYWASDAAECLSHAERTLREHAALLAGDAPTHGVEADQSGQS